MNLQLPKPVEAAVQPLFDALPLSNAMARLVPDRPADAALSDHVRQIIQHPAIAAHPSLVAGLWLYVDDLDRSHTVSQAIDDATGAFWHGVMHRREGDFWNSHYWFRRVGKHAAMKRIDDYDADRFIDEVEAAHRRSEMPARLQDLQRREWAALFQWCVEQIN